MAAASSPPWGSWWRGSKPFRHLCQKPSTESEVRPLRVQKLRARGESWVLIQAVVCISLPLTPSALCSGPTSSVRGGLLCLVALGFHRDGPCPLRVTAFLCAPHSDSRPQGWHSGVQLEKASAFQPHGLSRPLSAVHGGEKGSEGDDLGRPSCDFPGRSLSAPFPTRL